MLFDKQVNLKYFFKKTSNWSKDQLLCVKAFSLIEILIVILIISLLATVAIPRFTRGTVTNAQKFINSLNKIVHEGVKQALASGEGSEVNLNLRGKKIELYTKDRTPYKTAEIPSTIEVTDFFINGKNEFSAAGGERINAFFYINNDGIAQDVKIIFNDKNTQKANNLPRIYNIEINPFSAKFQL